MYRERFNMWLKSSFIDDKTKEELQAIEKLDDEIEDRFYKNLEFGTGGMRGKIGAGTNRMNIYTVGKATQGISDYLNERFPEGSGVAIAYDSRHMSPEFAAAAADVFAANGIEVYLFESLRPTPELSFAVRHLGCKAGIVVTASHNPPEYNGYKVYNEYGGQVVTKEAENIIERINRLSLPDIKHAGKDERRLINIIGSTLDDAYINEVMKLKASDDIDKNMKIVYTPLHGSGNILVRRALSRRGFANVYIVSEQELPNGDFPTVKSPNPEDIEALDMAVELAKKMDADVIIGTDPDCDRVGLIVKERDGSYRALSGNQTGALLLNYILSMMEINGCMPDNPTVIKTIVTSELGRVIAASYGAETVDTLTGFKYIAEKMRIFEEEKNRSFVFGYEESYGFLAGTFVRDKDAVIASMLICEMAAYYKKRNKSITEVLNELYDKYGYYLEETISMTFGGASGQNKMKSIMDYFRENKYNRIGGINIPIIRDYKMGMSTNLVKGSFERLDYPKSDVLKFCFEDGSWFVLRPSGTEPKLKIYFSIKGENEEKAKKLLEDVKKEVEVIINHVVCDYIS